MTKFETIGVSLQLEAESKIQAQKRFEHSCDICCRYGIHIECDRCAIQTIHNQVSEVLVNVSVRSIRFA